MASWASKGHGHGHAYAYNGYGQRPLTSAGTRRWSWSWNSLRRKQVICICLALLGFWMLFGRRRKALPEPVESEPLKLPGPPTFERLRKWEDDLPQHNLSLPFPEGRTGRYVKFSNQMNFVGWNNVLNERLMDAHLAYMSNRAYVFSEYRWAPEHYPWPRVQQHPELGGPRTPLNALLSGPMVGGPWDASDPAPRSISERHFEVVCPPASRRLLRTEVIKPQIPDEGNAPGSVIFDYWQKLLLEAPEGCIEIVPPEVYDTDPWSQIFNMWMWGNERILSLWEYISKSPVSKLMGPSPIVQAAVDRNAYLFLPRGPRPPTAHPAPRDPYARMLAVHLRRGDYLKHCVNLAGWGSTYYSWAQLPAPYLLEKDKFKPLPEGDPKRVETMLTHCLPSAEELVDKIAEVREEWVSAGAGKESRVLDILYLLTNEHGPWLADLAASLRKAGWHTIVTTRDLELDVEQEEASMAVDMEIARKAAVFLGNGWSSFTSNIIHMRLVDGREAVSIRLT